MWADRSLFLAGNVAFNENINTEKKDVAEAITLWEQLIREYPKSNEAHRASYYIGVAYEYTKRNKEAEAAYESFIRNYPDSPFVRLVREHHLAIVTGKEGK